MTGLTSVLRFLRRNVAGVVALALVAVLLLAARLPGVSREETAGIAGGYGFESRSIALPQGFPERRIRAVNQDYANIDAWISSVGAAIAMNDLDGDGLANDLCVVDPRTDQVSITPAPVAGAEGRYTPYALTSGDLPMNPHMAPMGCTPADVDQNGRMDIVVYYWGRTPIVHLARPGVAQGPEAWRATELVPNAGGPVYTGEQWNTNAVAVDDFDSDGTLDLYVGNYFPDGPVLDPTVSGGVAMNASLSNATNGGHDHVFRGVAGTAAFVEQPGVLPEDTSGGWVLGSSAADVDGDQRPELYLAQDHGRDAMLHNRSTPGEIRFEAVTGDRDPTVPKSKRMGADSFKGMAADFADLNRDGVSDLFVSNITQPYGIQESNFQWMATEPTPEAMGAAMTEGRAPWVDDSTAQGTAWSGWAWDAKAGDFDNSGNLAIAQATGFVKGETNRWPQLQELATANDTLVSNPAMWPRVSRGDDLSGNQPMRFFAPRPGGGYADLSHALGLDVPVPTRGVATGDADGDGRLDLAIARQWEEPAFYRNTAPDAGNAMTLNLVREGTQTAGPGAPVVGATAEVRLPDGRAIVERVDGGGGHSGKRSSEVHLGLGAEEGPLPVALTWRDATGATHSQTVDLTPGRHTVALGQAATVSTPPEDVR